MILLLNILLLFVLYSYGVLVAVSHLVHYLLAIHDVFLTLANKFQLLTKLPLGAVIRNNTCIHIVCSQIIEILSYDIYTYVIVLQLLNNILLRTLPPLRWLLKRLLAWHSITIVGRVTALVFRSVGALKRSLSNGRELLVLGELIRGCYAISLKINFFKKILI